MSCVPLCVSVSCVSCVSLCVRAGGHSEANALVLGQGRRPHVTSRDSPRDHIQTRRLLTCQCPRDVARGGRAAVILFQTESKVNKTQPKTRLTSSSFHGHQSAEHAKHWPARRPARSARWVKFLLSLTLLRPRTCPLPQSTPLATRVCQPESRRS